VTFAKLATERGIALSANDYLRHDIIERLMCDIAVDLKTPCKAYDVVQNTLGDEMERLSPLAEDGIVEVDDGCVTVTDERRPFVCLGLPPLSTAT
jgi:oxygen-independent coproporphyrinogen-3 oxidase